MYAPSSGKKNVPPLAPLFAAISQGEEGKRMNLELASLKKREGGKRGGRKKRGSLLSCQSILGRGKKRAIHLSFLHRGGTKGKEKEKSEKGIGTLGSRREERRDRGTDFLHQCSGKRRGRRFINMPGEKKGRKKKDIRGRVFLREGRRGGGKEKKERGGHRLCEDVAVKTLVASHSSGRGEEGKRKNQRSDDS